MIRKLIQLFRKSKPKETVTLYPFAVEARLMLDENTEITKFVALIHARSKRDAKFQITHRAFVKAGAVANKKTIDQYKKTKK